MITNRRTDQVKQGHMEACTAMILAEAKNSVCSFIKFHNRNATCGLPTVKARDIMVQYVTRVGAGTV